jgi:hypothetical protein
MPEPSRENAMSSRAVHIVATNTGVGGWVGSRSVRGRVESNRCSLTLLFEPVFDGDATCFVGTSACGSMLSEGKRGREVLVTGGT